MKKEKERKQRSETDQGKKWCFDFEGEDHHVRTETITVAEIRDIVELDPSLPIVQVLSDGTQKVLQETDEVNLSKGCSVKRKPRFVRG